MDWATIDAEACAIAKPIDELRPRTEDAAPAAGVLNPLV
jgi:hypothetical protein